MHLNSLVNAHIQLSFLSLSVPEITLMAKMINLPKFIFICPLTLVLKGEVTHQIGYTSSIFQSVWMRAVRALPNQDNNVKCLLPTIGCSFYSGFALLVLPGLSTEMKNKNAGLDVFFHQFRNGDSDLQTNISLTR